MNPNPRTRARVASVAAVALSCLPTLAAAAAPSPAALGSAVDAYAKPLVDAGHLSGQLLIARNGEIVVERNFGWANAELRAPVTPETRFCIASITKPMTVHLAFRLIEQRRIAYRDSIARWLPDFPKADSITIEHLLRHRSGIPHEILPDSEMTRPRTAEEMVARAQRLPLVFSPGSGSLYSTGGFTVLARILELASGRSYPELLQEHLFGPLEMKHSCHPGSIELLPGRAAGYLPGVGGLENAPFQDFSGLVGGGSVWSTARDIHRFVQGVVNGKLGRPQQASWLRNGRLDFNGVVAGFRAYADYDSASGLEVVFLGNMVTGAPDLLREAVRKLAAGETVPAAVIPQPSTTPMSDERMRRFEGVFLLENGLRLNMRVRGGGLWANEWRLLPAADGTFFSPRDYGVIRGIDGPDGRITRLEWTQRGQVYPAPRVGD